MLWRLPQPVCQAAVDRLHLVIEPVLVALRVATEVRIPLERVLKGCPVDSDLGRAVTRRVYGDLPLRPKDLKVLRKLVPCHIARAKD